MLDFFSEIRRWIVAPSPKSGGTGGGKGVGAGNKTGGGGDHNSPVAAPSIVDLWAMQKLGLQCSRVLGMWVAEDSESLPQRFLEALPVLLALKAGEEVRGCGILSTWFGCAGAWRGGGRCAGVGRIGRLAVHSSV